MVCDIDPSGGQIVWLLVVFVDIVSFRRRSRLAVIGRYFSAVCGCAAQLMVTILMCLDCPKNVQKPCLVLSGSFRFFPVLSDSVWFRLVLSGSVWFFPVLSGSVWFHPVPSGSVRFFMVLYGKSLRPLWVRELHFFFFMCLQTFDQKRHFVSQPSDVGSCLFCSADADE